MWAGTVTCLVVTIEAQEDGENDIRFVLLLVLTILTIKVSLK